MPLSAKQAVAIVAAVVAAVGLSACSSTQPNASNISTPSTATASAGGDQASVGQPETTSAKTSTKTSSGTQGGNTDPVDCTAGTLSGTFGSSEAQGRGDGLITLTNTGSA